VPKLWNETIEAHRRAVRETALDVTAALVAEHGAAAVTMSQIAAAAGIGRATLYKYFPDVESLLAGWYEREVAAQLALLAEVRDREAAPGRRLAAVLAAYVRLVREQPPGLGSAAGPAVGADDSSARGRLLGLFAELLAQAADAGAIRDDIAPQELAGYCLHSLGAAAEPVSGSARATERLLAVVLAGLDPPLRPRQPGAGAAGGS